MIVFLPRIFAISFCLSTLCEAESPVILGLRGVLSTFAPLLEKTTHLGRSAAAELLSRYVKVKNGNHLLQFAPATGTGWTEINNLQLTRVTAQAVSATGHANGVAESYLVSISSEMFRNYNCRTGKWTEWYNGHNSLLPPCIEVTRHTDGQWIAQSASFSSFIAFTAHGNPGLIPLAEKQVLATNSSTPPANAFLTQNTTTASSPAATNALSKASDPMGDAANQIMTASLAVAFLIALLGIAPAVIRYIYRKNKKSASQRKGSMRPHRVPPPLLSALPSPLPVLSSSPEISIIEARSHLLTAAEQAFLLLLHRTSGSPISSDNYRTAPRKVVLRSV